MTDELSYAFAAGIFGRERVFRLGAQSLEWHDGRHSESIAYSDVASVNLYSAYPPNGSATQICSVRTRAGARCVLKSKSVRAWGRSEDRGANYGPFVRELLDRISSAAPQARFFDGLPTAAYFAQAVVLAVIGLLIIAELVRVIVDWRTGSDGAATAMILMGILIAPAVAIAKTVLRGRQRRLASESLAGDLRNLGLSPRP